MSKKILEAAKVALIASAIITAFTAAFVVYWNWLGTIHPHAQHYCELMLFLFLAIFFGYLVVKDT